VKGVVEMAQTSINIRIDEDIKKQADSLFSDLGMNMSTAFNVFVRQALREQGIPFEISKKKDPFYSASNMSHLMRGIEALDAGKGVEHDIIEVA
jgi:DNA-damage-inducible protein J